MQGDTSEGVRSPSPAIIRDGKVYDVFGAGGVLAQHIKGYEQRVGQVQLYQAIKNILENGGSLVAEAPCGVGKSFAAAVPLTKIAREKRNSPVSSDGQKYGPSVIATATIALQEQLVNKDLPMLAEVLPWKFSYALLKGKSNYLCHKKMKSEVLNSSNKRTVTDEVSEWSRRTLTGDRSELGLDISDEEWSRYSSGDDDCRSAACPYFKECYAELARGIALESDVVVANYHVLLSSYARMLDNFGDIICDEAHELPRIARDIFGFSVTPARIKHFCKRLDEVNGMMDLVSHGSPWPKEILDQSEILFYELLMQMEEHDPGGTKRIEYNPTRSLIQLIDLVEGSLHACKDVLDSLSEAVPRQVWLELKMLHDRAEELASHLRSVSEQKAYDWWVYWMEYKTTKRNDPYVSLEARPFRAASLIGRTIFKLDRHKSVILMSATMQTSTGFEFIRRETGAPEETQEIVAPSPFIPAEQAALVIPRFVMIPPKRDSTSEDIHRYNEQIAASAGMLIEAMDGRTLCLFTSWSMLNYVYTRLSGHDRMKKYRFLKQGRAPTQKLVVEFTSDESSVLMGVTSMWQGIDVPGDALKGLFIHKIPFPVPSHPINEAMCEYLDMNYGERASFNLWSVPIATTTIQQGMGRLIRSTKDTGVVMVADKRLEIYRYGKQIMRALPRFARFADLAAAKRFLPHVFESSANGEDDGTR